MTISWRHHTTFKGHCNTISTILFCPSWGHIIYCCFWINFYCWLLLIPKYMKNWNMVFKKKRNNKKKYLCCMLKLPDIEQYSCNRTLMYLSRVFTYYKISYSNQRQNWFRIRWGWCHEHMHNLIFFFRDYQTDKKCENLNKKHNMYAKTKQRKKTVKKQCFTLVMNNQNIHKNRVKLTTKELKRNQT